LESQEILYIDNSEDSHTGGAGTLEYMAPEILKEEPYNNKCDLYSIGATLYFLVKESQFVIFAIRNLQFVIFAIPNCNS